MENEKVMNEEMNVNVSNEQLINEEPVKEQEQQSKIFVRDLINKDDKRVFVTEINEPENNKHFFIARVDNKQVVLLANQKYFDNEINLTLDDAIHLFNGEKISKPILNKEGEEYNKPFEGILKPGNEKKGMFLNLTPAESKILHVTKDRAEHEHYAMRMEDGSFVNLLANQSYNSKKDTVYIDFANAEKLFNGEEITLKVKNNKDILYKNQFKVEKTEDGKFLNLRYANELKREKRKSDKEIER